MSAARTPRRIQRRRTKGWRKPEGAVYVGRGSGFGNPRKVGSTSWTVLPGGWIDKRPHQPLTAQQAVDSFINSHTHDVDYLRVIRERLAGRDLMCWCPIGQPCHADWLLELANSPRPVEDFVDHSPKPAFLATETAAAR
ncbi:DUF4326 domain-containing protein [Streptomyces sp. MJP52]|uniref:DUF4326 domain-containing protein n=1 Tax=Streptomyces sp. MJP52 TaxID=2940555 RepID=UPI002476C413|nr:DUF4326 domain-containing protein [Streptomyces sp. MJP52]MDH6224301.1 hypothetical protein [Streptomyces sp. MJP52]